jgi:hypothetical protein
MDEVNWVLDRLADELDGAGAERNSLLAEGGGTRVRPVNHDAVHHDVVHHDGVLRADGER